MDNYLIFPAVDTPALGHACTILRKNGFDIASEPTPPVTHLLLGVPSFDADGRINGGGSLCDLLSMLPDDVTVIGGNLTHPALAGYKTVDLLKDPEYLAVNAALTAHCAVIQAWNRLPIAVTGCDVLVIGWGRIGKCLADLLRRLGASVSIAARKETDRAMAKALGCDALSLPIPQERLSKFRVIFSTAPAAVLTESQSAACRPDCLKVDLASCPSIICNNVYWAKGLPGKHVPEASGQLIAETILRLIPPKEALL